MLARVVQRSRWMQNRLLGKENDIGYVCWDSRRALDARLDFLKYAGN